MMNPTAPWPTALALLILFGGGLGLLGKAIEESSAIGALFGVAVLILVVRLSLQALAIRHRASLRNPKRQRP